MTGLVVNDSGAADLIIKIRSGEYVQAAGKHKWVKPLLKVFFMGFLFQYGLVGGIFYMIRNNYIESMFT